MKRQPDGTRIVHQIGVLRGNPVVPEVVWDSDRGPQAGYEDLLAELGVAA